jgi:hypothetical protein
MVLFALRARTLLLSSVIALSIITTMFLYSNARNRQKLPLDHFENFMYNRKHSNNPVKILVTDTQDWFLKLIPKHLFDQCSLKCNVEFGEVYKPVNQHYDLVLTFPFKMSFAGRGACSNAVSAATSTKEQHRYLNLYAQMYIEPNQALANCKDTGSDEFEKEPIDMSLTWHRNSTLLVNYYSIARIPTRTCEEIVKDNTKRFKGMCVFISNCVHFNAARRVEMIKELSKYVPMRSYGMCLKNAETKQNKIDTLANCMFYTSIENSWIEDYVTEKFYEGFIPAPAPLMVYLGAPNMNEFSPTREDQHPAYVDMSKFASMAELGEHLNMLLNDEKAYNRYFEWRKTGIPEKDFSSTFLEHGQSDFSDLPCRLCAVTAEMQEARKVLAMYGIMPTEGRYKVSKSTFEGLLANIPHVQIQQQLRVLFDKAYGRYWRKENHKTDWNRSKYKHV